MKPVISRARDRTDIGIDIVEPEWFPLESEPKRVAVLDHNFNPPRVVRYVGWRRCMSCRSQFLSPDVVRIRMCEMCKSYKSEVAVFTAHGALVRKPSRP